MVGVVLLPYMGEVPSHALARPVLQATRPADTTPRDQRNTPRMLKRAFKLRAHQIAQAQRVTLRKPRRTAHVNCVFIQTAHVIR